MSYSYSTLHRSAARPLQALLATAVLIGSLGTLSAQDDTANETACPDDLRCPGDAECSCFYYESGRLRSVEVDYDHDGVADERWDYDQNGQLTTGADESEHSSSAWGIDFNVAFAIGFPQGELAQNIENVGLGIDFSAGIGLGESPMVLGLHFGFLMYGSETRREPFSTTIPDVYVNVNTANSIALGHLFLRLRTDFGILQPYIDGLLGFSRFATSTSIESDSSWDNDDDVASTTNFDDFAWSYGVGFGVNIEVFDEGVGRGFVNLGGRYLIGGEAEYLLQGSISESSTGGLIYDVSRSKTDIFTLLIGFTYQF